MLILIVALCGAFDFFLLFLYQIHLRQQIRNLPLCTGWGIHTTHVWIIWTSNNELHTNTAKRKRSKRKRERKREWDRCIQKKNAIFWHFVNTGIEVHGKEISKDNEREQEKNVGKKIFIEQTEPFTLILITNLQKKKECRWRFLSSFYQCLPN